MPRAWVSEEAAARVSDVAAGAHPHEAGGVLLGVFTERGRPWIVRAVAVKSRVAGAIRYELPTGARPTAVDEARRDEPRLGYLGDWHSHPADIGPSGVDLETMRRVAVDPDAIAPHPLLLIARRRAPDEYGLDLRELARRRFRKLRIVAAGGLATDAHETAEAVVSSSSLRKLSV